MKRTHGLSTHSKKDGNVCPGCGKVMQPWIFDVGYGVTVPTLHCTHCQFNKTDQKVLSSSMQKLRERMHKQVSVVTVGEGLGIRFPKELVREYAIKKGIKVTLKPGKKGI